MKERMSFKCCIYINIAFIGDIKFDLFRRLHKINNIKIKSIVNLKICKICILHKYTTLKYFKNICKILILFSHYLLYIYFVLFLKCSSFKKLI